LVAGGGVLGAAVPCPGGDNVPAVELLSGTEGLELAVLLPDPSGLATLTLLWAPGVASESLEHAGNAAISGAKNKIPGRSSFFTKQSFQNGAMTRVWCANSCMHGESTTITAFWW
jgi:hypothetical protein